MGYGIWGARYMNVVKAFDCLDSKPKCWFVTLPF